MKRNSEEYKAWMRAYQKEYYEKNKEQHRAYCREYQRKFKPVLTPEQKLARREYYREWRKKHPTYHKEWLIKNYGEQP